MRGGVNYHRMVTPHVNLLKKYPEFKVAYSVDDRSWIKLDLSKINILVFTRMISLEGLNYKGVNYSLEEIVKKYKKLGIKFVVDIDDYWILDRNNPMYKSFDKHYQKQVRLSLRLADLVITTNKRLADRIRPINKNIEIIPNCIDKTHNQWDYSPLPKNTKFGYLGATSHKGMLILWALIGQIMMQLHLLRCTSKTGLRLRKEKMFINMENFTTI